MRSATPTALLCLLCLATPSGLLAAVSAPESPAQQKLSTHIESRAKEYRARLNADYHTQIEAWAQAFIARRHDAVLRAGSALAAEATTIRSTRHIDWSAVAADPQFLSFERQQVAALLDPARLREELTAWARGVENQTREEMIEYFRQLIAEDLGRVFDASLRDHVIDAVRAIPLETLVAADASRIEASIQAALPSAALTRGQRAALTAAASALAYAAGYTIAAAIGAPDLGAQIAALAVLLTQALVQRPLDALDRQLSGDPTPDLIAHQLELALVEWQRLQLQGRLTTILATFGDDVVERLRLEARHINLQASAHLGAVQ